MSDAEGAGPVRPRNYRKAENPKFSCPECAFMFPRLAIGGCRYVRGVIHAEDTCDEFKPRGGTGSART